MYIIIIIVCVMIHFEAGRPCSLCNGTPLGGEALQFVEWYTSWLGGLVVCVVVHFLAFVCAVVHFLA